jgi:hypothetical protein
VAPAEPAAAVTTCIALSFNGRTSDSDSLDRGSNPWGATKKTKELDASSKALSGKSGEFTGDLLHPKPVFASRCLHCDFE